jgi:hypothetical protein
MRLSYSQELEEQLVARPSIGVPVGTAFERNPRQLMLPSWRASRFGNPWLLGRKPEIAP